MIGRLSQLVASIAIVAIVTVASEAAAAKSERSALTIGVGGKGLLSNLPLTLAERLGYFKEQGLIVSVVDFRDEPKALQSLIGGSAHAMVGAYEHVIRMQARKYPLVAVIELGRYPGMVLAARKSATSRITSIRDLKGMKIGLTAAGSSTHFFVKTLIDREGLQPSDITILPIGTGSGAIATAKRSHIDAIAHLDPMISKLEYDGDVVVLLWTLASILMTIAFSHAGLLDPALFLVSAIFVIPIHAGVTVGHRVVLGLNQRLSQTVVLLALTTLGIYNCAKALS